MYTREEYKNFKNKFKEQFFQDFDKRTSQYIAEHKEVYYKRDDD